MSKLNSLRIENFRVFGKETPRFDLAPLTILTGANSSGKSSFIKALGLLHELPLSIQEKTNYTPNKLTSPLILRDIREINFQSLAKTMGGFDNNINNNSNDGEILFEVYGFNQYLSGETTICFKVRLGYISSSSGLFKNGVLSRLEILAVKDNEEKTVFKILKNGDVYSYGLNWKYFFEQYVFFNNKEIVNKSYPDILSKFITKKPPLFAEKNKSDDNYSFFEPETPFLKVSIPYFATEEDEDEYFNRLMEFLDKYSIEYDRVSSRDYMEASVSEKMWPFFKEVLNLNEELSGVISTEIFHNFNSFSFGAEKSPGEFSAKHILADYLNNFALHLSFTNDSNGKAARIFFDNFTLENISSLLCDVLSQFLSYNFLLAHRTAGERVMLAENPELTTSATQKFFNKYIHASNSAQERVRKTCKELLSKEYFDLAEDIDFKLNEDSYTGSVLIKKAGVWYNLMDQGFGVSSVLAVIMMVAMSDSSIMELLEKEPKENQEVWEDEWVSTLVIEEPEMNLHPKAQSRLADVFAKIHKNFGTRFIIETHSEYLIRKLQYLTAKRKIKPDDTAIYYFYPPNEVPEGEVHVKKINIQEDGSLTNDFGSGFFDEATGWKFKLLELKNSQRN